MIAFLRAVNVGQRKVPMADLRERLDDAGYGPVATHIQTGNVRLSGGDRDALEGLLEQWYGFAVPVIWFSEKQLATLLAHTPDAPIEAVQNHYVALLQDARSGAGLDAALESLDVEGEAARRVGRAVHLWYAKGVHESKLSNAWVERHAGVATSRSIKVLRAIDQKWGG